MIFGLCRGVFEWKIRRFETAYESELYSQRAFSLEVILNLIVCKSCDEYGKPGNFGVVGESFGRTRQLSGLVFNNNSKPLSDVFFINGTFLRA